MRIRSDLKRFLLMTLALCGALAALSCHTSLSVPIAQNGVALQQSTEAAIGQLLAASAERLLSRSGPEFLHNDHRDNLSLATDRTGGVLGRQTFTPFGSLHAQTGHVARFGFSGQERDASTGLLHYQHRYLDPEAGRWMSSDPHFAISSPDKLTGHPGEAGTGYALVANHPLNAVDPNGLLSLSGVGSKLKSLAGKSGKFKSGSLKSMGADYQGENKGKKIHNMDFKTQYLGKLERRKFKVSVDSKGLMYTGGCLGCGKKELLDTTKIPGGNKPPFYGDTPQSAFSGKGHAIFVMDPKGNIYVGRHDVGKFHHSSFLGGKPVGGAGEMVVRNGVLEKVTTKSGHYQPGPEQVLNLGKELNSRGVNAGRVPVYAPGPQQGSTTFMGWPMQPVQATAGPGS